MVCLHSKVVEADTTILIYQFYIDMYGGNYEKEN